MLLYRFPEAQLAKLVTPFLVDPREVGGLGLSTAEIGLVYGTIGTIGLTLAEYWEYRRLGRRIEEMDLADGVGNFPS